MSLVEAGTETTATTGERPARRRRRALYLLGLALLVFAALSLANTVLRAPSRSGVIDLAGQPVRITVSMVPDPPKTGPIPLQVVITDNAGVPAPVDQVIVRYGMEQGTPAEAVAMSGTSGGVYRVQIEFAGVGGGWIEIDLRRGIARGQLRLAVDVRPNI
ncbi:MAG: hypothetical protein ACRDIC_13850 [bacterium]